MTEVRVIDFVDHHQTPPAYQRYWETSDGCICQNGWVGTAGLANFMSAYQVAPIRDRTHDLVESFVKNVDVVISLSDFPTDRLLGTNLLAARLHTIWMELPLYLKEQRQRVTAELRKIEENLR